VSPDDLAAALAAARDRDPRGRRLRAMRWAAAGGAVWQFPAALSRPTAALVCRTIDISAADPGDGWRFRLATAARQDLWRALRDRPGLVPVVRAGPVADGRLALTLAAAMAAPDPGVAPILACLAGSAAPAAWVRFAGSRR